ncbi:MAG: Rrf2 family transcriptional regulator [Dehalococcoidia bacterium]|jgi:Rrf2 family transcriptional regulator, iron-sulfur cluster assembly transcription factor|nr:Rrf2 family transcriptional regulator [Dehalococcoidia bacterium]
MQVTLGRKGDYSVRAAIDVARYHGQRRRKAREIAATMDIPVRYIPQILANLVRAGLLKAVSGPDGGYTLSREPSEITLLEIVVGAEGPVELSACVLRGGPCDWERACPLHIPWTNAQHALSGELSKWTLESLSLTDQTIEAGNYELPPGIERHDQPDRLGIRD